MEGQRVVRTYITAADLSTRQWCFAKDTSSGLALCGDGDDSVGVIDGNAAGIGAAMPVVTSGQTDVLAGGTITEGQYVSADANGKAVVAGSSDYILGQARENAASGDIFSVLLGGNRHL